MDSEHWTLKACSSPARRLRCKLVATECVWKLYPTSGLSLFDLFTYICIHLHTPLYTMCLPWNGLFGHAPISDILVQKWQPHFLILWAFSRLRILAAVVHFREVWSGSCSKRQNDKGNSKTIAAIAPFESPDPPLSCQHREEWTLLVLNAIPSAFVGNSLDSAWPH